MSNKITVLGAGSWGTVLAHILSSSGYSVNLWARSTAYVNHIKLMGRFTRPSELSLPDSIHLTSCLEEALGGELLVCALPSEAVPEIIKQIKQSPKLILSATKGLEQATGKRMSELWQTAFPSSLVAALSGPNLSADAALAKPMRTIIAATDLIIAQNFCSYFQIPHFKTEASSDLIGLEISGAAKNVIALAAGAWDGLNLGASGKGAIFTRALQELTHLVELLGGKPQTTCSVGGIGDLYITCTSPLSRNYKTGYLLASGKTLAQINQELKGQVAEGIWTTPLIHQLALNNNCDFKVCESVYKMLTLNLSQPEEKYKLEEMFIALV